MLKKLEVSGSERAKPRYSELSSVLLPSNSALAERIFTVKGGDASEKGEESNVKRGKGEELW